MIDFVMNSEELEAMSGLPHIQQLTYLRGIRPYMDVKSGVVGIKRRISYQSIAEQLYIEPHQGIKSISFSRAQARRALAALERVGLISLQSEEKQLILKCNLATQGYFVQNKVVTNPSQKAVINPNTKSPVNTGLTGGEPTKAVIADPPKADTPLKEDNYYIYFLQRFEHFWRMYPEKKSRERAFETFRQINPDEALLRIMLQALEIQIKARTAKEARGEWVPPWKYPVNWLAQKCWEDEVKIERTQEKKHAKRCTNTKTSTVDPFWNPEPDATASVTEDECKPNNVIQLQCYRQQ